MPTGTLVDRFVVIEHLGQGGMGVVYSAFDPQLDRKIALKFLRREIGTQERLLREAQAMARLSHPNVVQVFDVGSYHGRVFVAMEFVEGSTLKAWLKERPRRWNELWPVLRDAARGLAAAHAAGIVHRDFKPDNVLVDRHGRARVTDFGLARSSEGTGTGDPAGAAAPLGEPLTRTGAVVGTPMYMAPEQHLGEKTEAATDQFAFCVTLYDALYGMRPFAGDTLPALVTAVTSGEITPPPRDSAVPRWRRDLVLRGLSRRPADRFPSIDALAAALDRDPAVRRRRVLVAAAAVFLIGGAMTLLWLRGRSGESTVCTGAGARMAEVWNDTRSSELRAAFETVNRIYAADTAGRVIALLDKRADDWVAMHTEACAATRVSGVQSDTLLDLRMRCLDRRLVELDALSLLFRDAPDAEVVEKAFTLEAALPGLDVCSDTQSLMAEVPPPDDPLVRGRMDALRDRIAREVEPRVLIAPRQARAVLQSIANDVEAVPAPVLRAEFALQSAEVAERLQEFGEARKQLQIAVREAAAARDFRLAVRGWTKISLLENANGSPAAGESALLGLRAGVAAAGTGPIEEARLLLAEATVLQNQGDYRGALAKLERCHQLRAAALGADHLSTLLTEASIAQLQMQIQDVTAARRRLEQINKRLEDKLGPDHPELLTNLGQLAIAFRTEGNYDAAMRYAHRAVALARAAFGLDHLAVARMLELEGSLCARTGDHTCSVDNQRESVRIRRSKLAEPNDDLAGAVLALGNALKAAGDFAAARASYDEALQLFEASVGAQHPNFGMALYNRAIVLDILGEHALAVADYRRAIEIVEKAQGPQHRWVGNLLNGLADSLLRGGDASGAIPVARRAVDIASKNPAEPLMGALARNSLGRALYDSGSDLRQGKQLVLAARAQLAAVGPGAKPYLATVDRWLAARNIRP